MNALSADATASNKPTFIDILLDETGSMQSCHSATVAGFNKFVADQRELGGECYLTLTKFDSLGLKTPYVNLPLDMVPELTFFPGSSTNLYDVVGARVSSVLNQGRHGRSLVVVLTDGGENASREYSQAQVQAVVSNALSAGVTFLYFGAGAGARQTALAMGFPEHVITVFDTRNMNETMQTVSAQTRAFRVGA
jgi:hypothetical protein